MPGVVPVLSHFLLTHLRRPKLRVLARQGWSLDLNLSLTVGEGAYTRLPFLECIQHQPAYRNSHLGQRGHTKTNSVDPGVSFSASGL